MSQPLPPGRAGSGPRVRRRMETARLTSSCPHLGLELTPGKAATAQRGTQGRDEGQLLKHPVSYFLC